MERRSTLAASEDIDPSSAEWDERWISSAMESTPSRQIGRGVVLLFFSTDSAAVCTYLTRSLSPKKYDWSRATPSSSLPPDGETERLDTHTETRGLRSPSPPLACAAHAHPGAHTDIYAFEEEKETEQTPAFSLRLNDRVFARSCFSIVVWTRRANSFHYFRISALKAALPECPIPLISVPLLPVVMHAASFPAWLKRSPNRSFFFYASVSSRVDMVVGRNRSFI